MDARRLGTAFVAIGSISLVVCILLIGQTAVYLGTSDFTTGTVVAFREVPSKDPALPNYYPHITFATQSGEVFEFESVFGGSGHTYRVGEVVSVVYDPTHPKSAKINDPYNLWFRAGITGMVAIFFFASGWIFMRYRNSSTARISPKRTA
jgi:hypothetical protein